jgi:hypothetical protein
MMTNREIIEERDLQRRAELATDQLVHPELRVAARAAAGIERATTWKLRPPLHAVHKFSAEDIQILRAMAARGCSGKEIAIKLQHTPHAVRVKCVELGINLRPPKRQWHRLRVLIEPLLNKAIVLRARRRGMRAGEWTRRILTATVCYDLDDIILDRAASRQQKLMAISANVSRVSVSSLELALHPQLQGRIGDAPQQFNVAMGK